MEKPQTHTAEEKPIHSISIRPYWKINTLQATWRRLRANCSTRNDHGGLRTVGIGRERWKPPCNSARRARSRSRNGCFTRNRRALGRTDALEKSACSILRLWPLASGRGTGASAIQPYSTLHVDDMHNRARDIKVVREREREKERWLPTERWIFDRTVAAPRDNRTHGSAILFDLSYPFLPLVADSCSFLACVRPKINRAGAMVSLLESYMDLRTAAYSVGGIVERESARRLTRLPGTKFVNGKGTEPTNDVSRSLTRKHVSETFGKNFACRQIVVRCRNGNLFTSVFHIVQGWSRTAFSLENVSWDTEKLRGTIYHPFCWIIFCYFAVTSEFW